MKTTPIILTEAQEKWLQIHFKHTKNQDIADRFGISLRSVSRLAKKRGLEKSTQFLKKCQEEAAKAAVESHIRNGTYPPKGFVIPGSINTRFHPGIKSVDRLGKRKEKQRLKNMLASRMKTLKSERARATFGLPQRTKLKVVRQPRAKITLRYYLKKQGYILDEQKRIAYYDENTKRGKRIESKPQMWYKFQPLN